MNEFSDNLHSSVLEVKGFFVLNGFRVWECSWRGSREQYIWILARSNLIQNLLQSPHLSTISPCSLARSNAPGLVAYEEIDLTKIGEESTHQDSTLVMHSHRERIHRRPRPRHHADATSMTCRVCSRITIGIFGHITTQSHAMDCRK
jgi:hypothetical protein